MSQKIQLTWIGPENKTIIEECYLISDDDVIYDTDTEPVLGAMEMMVKLDFVVFEDKDGIFCLHPKKIINIEML